MSERIWTAIECTSVVHSLLQCKIELVYSITFTMVSDTTTNGCPLK